MTALVRVTINGNPYRVPEGVPVTMKDIRRRIAGKIRLPGLDKAAVQYHRFLQKEWKRVTKSLVFESGMAFRVLVKVKKRGCRIVKGPDGSVAFACRRGD